MMQRMKNTLKIMSVLLASSAMIFAGCSPGNTGVQTTPTPIPTSIVPVNPTYRVQSGEVVAQLQFTARIVPALEQALYFASDGRVRNVFVKRGDRVTSSQLLADLEAVDDLERRTQLNELAIRRAHINLEIARTRLEMIEAQPGNANKDFEVAIQEYQVELSQIALEEELLATQDLEDALADAQLITNLDGEVLSISLVEGRVVEAYDAVAVVADLSELEVSVELDRSELEMLAEGMPAQISLVSQPGIEIEGSIRQLPYPFGGGSLEVEQEDTLVHVALDEPETGIEFELGDLVRVTVVLERKENVLWIPPQAVRTFEGRKFVVIQDGEIQRRVDVELGIQGGDRVEVVAGLEPGQIVIGP